MQIDLSCPIENQGTIVKTNSETNEPYLLLKLFNLSEKTITEAAFHVLAYDANGAELGSIPVLLEELSAEPKSYFAESKGISLADMEDAKNFIVEFDKVTFSDGTVYEPSEENTVDAEDSAASIDDALMLRKFVPEAVCFAASHDNYWKCPCGRANFVDSAHCVRCGRDKNEMLEKFASSESLQATLIAFEEAEAEKRAEEEKRAREETLAKKAKIKRIILIALIAVVAACALSVAGFFVYRAVLNYSADKAVENGDYLKAYEIYAKTGNEKIGELTERLQGNTPENLMFQSGLIASDEEYLYYLVMDEATYAFNLIREDKKSGEKTTLTDAAGGSLNVTKDWIYFVSVENGHVMRISKDGQTIETVIESGTTYLSVIGNTIYHMKTDYDNPNNLPEEQCQVLASQGQMATYRRLYKTDVETKKSVLVSEEGFSACAIYGGRIYYLTDGTDTWTTYNLYSMDLNGKDKRVEVDVPVASFLIQDGSLYYVRMYVDAARGNEIESAHDLDYTIVRKNLSDGSISTLAEDYLTAYISASDEKLFFIALDRNAYIDAQTNPDAEPVTESLYALDFATGEIKNLVSGSVQIFNISGDDIILYTSTSGMCRIKTDGTGFEQLTTQEETPGTDAVPSEDVAISPITE